MYQPSHYDPSDMTVMYHLKFKPSGTGPWPTVLMLPPDVFRYEIKVEGTTKERVATKDLIDNGFLVFQIEHRLAFPGLLEGQTPHCSPSPLPSPSTCTAAQIASGRPPQQTDDVKQQILAALADPDCNGKIFLIGGSAGGCLAVYVALDPYPGNVTEWGPLVMAKIKGVVGLSGVYDLSLRVAPTGGVFIDDVQNYTNTTDNYVGLEYQYSKSPIALVVAANNIPPIRLYASLDEHVVIPAQSENMRNALLTHDPNADVIWYEITGSEHAFNYWHAINNNTGQCVSAEVISFLNAHR